MEQDNLADAINARLSLADEILDVVKALQKLHMSYHVFEREAENVVGSLKSSAARYALTRYEQQQQQDASL